MSQSSFENVEVFSTSFVTSMRSIFFQAKWVPELRDGIPDAKILLVGTQNDLRDDQEKLEGLYK